MRSLLLLILGWFVVLHACTECSILFMLITVTCTFAASSVLSVSLGQTIKPITYVTPPNSSKFTAQQRAELEASNKNTLDTLASEAAAQFQTFLNRLEGRSPRLVVGDAFQQLTMAFGVFFCARACACVCSVSCNRASSDADAGVLLLDPIANGHSVTWKLHHGTQKQVLSAAAVAHLAVSGHSLFAAASAEAVPTKSKAASERWHRQKQPESITYQKKADKFISVADVHSIRGANDEQVRASGSFLRFSR